MPPLSFPVVVVFVAVVIAAVIDVWTFKIANVLTFPLLLSGLLYHSCMGGMPQLAISLLGAFFGFSILLIFYVLGGMGAGDVKLAAALGAWLGMPLIAYLLLASALAAGVYSLTLILIYGGAAKMWGNLQILYHRLIVLGRHLGSEDRLEAEVSAPDCRRRVIPFAFTIALGFLCLLIWVGFQARP